MEWRGMADEAWNSMAWLGMGWHSLRLYGILWDGIECLL